MGRQMLVRTSILVTRLVAIRVSLEVPTVIRSHSAPSRWNSPHRKHHNAMATLGLGTSHLQCAKLSEAAVNLLEPFATWLSALKFSPHAGGFETLVHPQLVEKINPLLTELGLLQKKYSVIRITGDKPAPFYNSKGAAYIIPLRVVDGSAPTISEHPLVPGEITYITFGVEVSPKLDLLFVLQ